MTVLETMLNIRRGLIERDKEQALSALTETIYYKVAPRVAPGDEFMLFKDEKQIVDFCKNNSLDFRAVSSIFDEMREERLLAPSGVPVVLTPLCVEKLCVAESSA
jgi:hypothetical protein